MGRDPLLPLMQLTFASTKPHRLAEHEIDRIRDLWGVKDLSAIQISKLEYAIGFFGATRTAGVKKETFEEGSDAIATSAKTLLQLLRTETGRCVARYIFDAEDRIRGEHFLARLAECTHQIQALDDRQFADPIKNLLFALACFQLGAAKYLPGSIGRTLKSSLRNRGTISFSGLCWAIAEILNGKPYTTSTMQQKFIDAWPKIRDEAFVQENLIDAVSGHARSKPTST